MADTLRQLVTTVANKLPTTTSNTTVYTVTAPVTGAVLSHIIVCNQTANPVTFRIAIVASGGTVTNNYDWIAYDCPINPNDSINIPYGGGMAVSDFIVVRTSVASALSFCPVGMEVQ